MDNEEEKLSPADEAMVDFDSVNNTYALLSLQVRRLLKSEFGKHLHKDSIMSCLHNFKNELMWGYPSMACPHAFANKKHEDTCQCKGTGFLPRSQVKDGKRVATNGSSS